MVLLLALGCADPVVHDTAAPDPTAGWVVGDGPLAPVSGRAFVFGPTSSHTLEGATVSVLEDPTYRATVDAHGSFALDVPSGAPLSFVLEQDGFLTDQTATLPVGPEGLEQVSFQVPTSAMADVLAFAAGADLRPDRCQVATTVSSAASPPYGGSGVGEPGAVVSISPSLPTGATGPVYFAYLSDALILPDPALTETSLDGGVLYADLPTGEYVLSATKPGVPLTSVVIRCRPGVLVNAAPPHGIQAGE